MTVRVLEDSGSTVAIVVAWELCWYRYEVDLGDEAAGARLAGQGMELEELPEEDRLRQRRRRRARRARASRQRRLSAACGSLRSTI